MGLISGIFGNASEADIINIQNEFSPLLVKGEVIQRVYKYIRDYFVFTNVRLVLVEKRDLVGKKIEFHSIPYSRILHFSIETAGLADLDHELTLYPAGSEPVTKKVSCSMDIFELQTAMANYVM